VVRSGLVRGLESVDEVFLVLWCQAGFTRLEGSRGPLGREPESSDEGACLGPRGLGGSRTRGVVGEDSRGERYQESIGRRVRGNPSQSRTDSLEGVKLRSR
jgi:hypothetical protein